MSDPVLSDVVRLYTLIPDLPMARNTVYAWAKRGYIPSARQIGGGEWVVSRKAIEAWLTGPITKPAASSRDPVQAPAAMLEELPALAALPETEALKALRKRLARPAALDRSVASDNEIGFADPMAGNTTITP